MGSGPEQIIRESGLRPKEKALVRESLAVIEQPECRPGEDTPSCATTWEYHGAWKRLSETDPTLGLRLLSMPQYRWPKAANYHRTNRALPQGDAPQISEGLWNRVMAFRWILQNLEGGEKRFRFVEETLAREQEHGLVFLWVAKTNMAGMTADETRVLKTAEESFKSASPAEQALKNKVLKFLYYEIELRETLSGPIK